MNKQRVEQQFSQYALAYDELAQVQVNIADHALGMLRDTLASAAFAPSAPVTILDLGCGTARHTQCLLECLPATVQPNHLLGIDLASGMLQCAQTSNVNAQFVQGDFDHLPMLDASVDVLFSSMALQWTQAPETVLAEIARTLKPGSHAVLAIMIDPSFASVKAGFTQVGHPDAINTFHARAQWCEAVPPALTYHATDAVFNAAFPSFHSMMQSIKGIGAGAKRTASQQGFTKRQYRYLQDYFADAACLDYHVLMLGLHKPNCT